MPADDSVRKELTVVLYPYTKCKHVWKVGSRVQRNVICLYNDNHTTRAQGLALNARTSKSNKKERKSFLQKDTKHCLLFSVGKIQPAEHAQPPKEKTGLTCFVSSFPWFSSSLALASHSAQKSTPLHPTRQQHTVCEKGKWNWTVKNIHRLRLTATRSNRALILARTTPRRYLLDLLTVYDRDPRKLPTRNGSGTSTGTY